MPLRRWNPSDGTDGGGGPSKRPHTTPSQALIDMWIRKQIDSTLAYRAKKKRWQLTSTYELKGNRDLRWLKQLDYKMRKEQARAEQAMLRERKLKAAVSTSK